MPTKLALPPLELMIARTSPRAERLSFLGVGVDILVCSQDTGGAWSLIHYTAPAHFGGPPPHRHRQMTETFRVLSGKLLFRLEGEEQEYAAGAVVTVPPGVAHGYSNPYNEPAEVLILCSPGGFEGYFREVARLVSRSPAWPPVDVSGLAALGENYDTLEA
jgi:mannose-6-phosphate isomerase-like protein (cupin superfamily)